MKLRLKSVAMLVAVRGAVCHWHMGAIAWPGGAEQVGMSRERLARIGPMMQRTFRRTNGRRSGPDRPSRKTCIFLKVGAWTRQGRQPADA